MSVAQLPRQSGFGFAETLITGNGFTANATVREAVQPFIEPVTVYVVFTLGLTAVLELVADPGFQVYDVAPVALSVADCPTQIAVGDADALTVGEGNTVTCTVRVVTQPNAFAP